MFLILCSCVSVFVCASVLQGQQRVTDFQAGVWEGSSKRDGVLGWAKAWFCSVLRETRFYDCDPGLSCGDK